MSLNRACPDAPLPVLADSAAVLGTAWIGAGAVLAQGTIVRSHQEAVSIGSPLGDRWTHVQAVADTGRPANP